MRKLYILLFIVVLPWGLYGQSILLIQPQEDNHCVEIGSKFKSKFLELLKTSDEIYIDGERYYISKSPLIFFSGYKNVFEGLNERQRGISRLIESIPEMGSLDAPWVEDKNYTILWKVVDGRLYINDVFFYIINSPDELSILFPDNEQYAAIEKLTERKFTKDDEVVNVKPEAPYGVIAATWVNGSFLIKKGLETMQSYEDWEENSKVYKLIIKDGKILSKSQITL